MFYFIESYWWKNFMYFLNFLEQNLTLKSEN